MPFSKIRAQCFNVNFINIYKTLQYFVSQFQTRINVRRTRSRGRSSCFLGGAGVAVNLIRMQVAIKSNWYVNLNVKVCPTFKAKFCDSLTYRVIGLYVKMWLSMF